MTKIVKISAWALAALPLLLLALALALQLPRAQGALAARAGRSLSGALGTRVELERIRLGPAGSIEVSGLYLEDQKQDTLWYSGTVAARVDPFRLLARTVKIESLRLENVVVNLDRPAAEGRFNLEFLAGADPYGERDVAASADPPDVDSRRWKIALRSLKISDVSAAYRDEIGGAQAQIRLGELSARGFSYAPGEDRMRLASLLLDDSSLRLWRAGDRPGAGGQGTDTTAAARGLDFSDLELRGLGLALSEVSLWNSEGSMRIERLAFDERCGFRLERLSAVVSADDSSASVKDLRLVTGFSSLAGSFAARYPGLEAARHGIRNARIDLVLSESLIGFGDAFYLRPDLRELLAVSDAEAVALDVSLAGSIDDLAAGKLELRVLGATRLRARGRVRGLPDIETARFEIVLAELGTGRDDLARLAPPGLIPAGIGVPASLSLTGEFSGTTVRFASRLEARSDFGRLAAELNLDRSGQFEQYRGTLSAESFDVGRLLKKSDLAGPVSLAATFEGRGLGAQELDARLQANVERASLFDYEYDNLRIDGRFRDRRFTGFAGMEDDNLAFRFEGDVDLAALEPVFAFDLDLRRADLGALRLAETENILRATVKADFTGASLGTLDGLLQVRNFSLRRGPVEYAVDSLVVAAAAREGLSRLDVVSDMLSGSYAGSVAIDELPAVVAGHLGRYFELHQLEVDEDAPERHFDFQLQLHDPRLLAEVLVPGIRELSPATVTGSYSQSEHRLEARIEAPRLHYGALELDSLSVRVSSGIESIAYGLYASRLALGAYETLVPSVRGNVAGDLVTFDIAMRDENRSVVFALGGGIESSAGLYTLRLGPEPLVIHYEPWTAAEDNYLRFGNGALLAHNLMIRHGPSLIAAQSEEGEEKAPPLFITAREFDISSLAPLLGAREPGSAGTLDATARLSDFQDGMKLEADLSLRGLVFGSVAVGDVAAWVTRDPAGRYDLRAELGGHGNQLRASGFVLTGNGGGEIDLDVEIGNVELASLEGFAPGELAGLGGSLYGRLGLAGPLAGPSIGGEIGLRDVSFTARRLNCGFRLADEKIVFDRDGIALDDFTILDSRGNRAVISGSISTGGPAGPTFAVDMRASDFLLLDTTRRDNDVFFGRIVLDSDISVRGDRDRPHVRAAMGLRRGTDLTVVVPERDPTLVDREGVVEFVPVDDRGGPIRDPRVEDRPARGAFGGLDLAVNMDIDPQTSLLVMIDETAGDFVRLAGRGTFSVGLDPDGVVGLAGRYEIAEGVYQMTFYEVSRRRFDIRRGSSIVWTGDPLDAEIDISAVYTVRASALELVGDYVPDAERRQYRRALPFQVRLNMAGRLMQPQIDFEIDMPSDQRGAFGGVVYGRVRQLNEQESERNKQVFALLVLGRFIPDNPLEMHEGVGLSAGARTSASKLLTHQLNALSGRYIRGLDITFDVESYEEYTAEGPRGRTELQLQVSRQFLDERIVVEAGGQFDLEGERKRQAEASDFAGDVAVEYRLTEDGRFRLRGFRVREHQGLIDGDLTSTGLSLVFARDFNRFSELLRRRKPPAPAQNDAAGDGGRE